MLTFLLKTLNQVKDDFTLHLFSVMKLLTLVFFCNVSHTHKDK